MPHPNELPASALRWRCDPSGFDFETTADVDPLQDVIGQERAVRAIEMGLHMKSPGYHIFVTGIEGTGKTTIVQDLLRRHAGKLDPPPEWCMVHNFSDPYRPQSFSTPAGRAAPFAKAMARFVEDVKQRLPAEFEGESFLKRRSEIQEKLAEQKRRHFESVEAAARDKSLAIRKSGSGYQIVPVQDGQPLSAEAFREFSPERREQVEADIRRVQSELESAFREMQKRSQSASQEMLAVAEEAARFVVQGRLDLLRREFSGCEGILSFLDRVERDIVENVSVFLPSGDAAVSGGGETDVDGLMRRYAVNVLASPDGKKGAPVVYEPNPSAANVFGRIERRAFMGTVTTDFTMVQAGSLLEANGGYLILEIDAVLMNPMVWEALKRSLQNKRLYIEDTREDPGWGAASLRPEPIPLEVKVVLLGGYRSFQLLQNHDPKFNKIFRVRADFDYEAPASGDVLVQYARFVAKVCREDALLPFTAGAVASLVEHGKTLVSRQEKLSLRFGPISGVIKEADYWARREGAERVEDAHVETAIREHRFRYNLYEEKIHEAYLNDTVMIDVEGDVVGQVNALAVYHMGEISFGRPARITAETFMGKHGVVNVEREAKLSGKTHDKGVLILSGFLGRTFAQKFPLSLSISITFEQNYGGVDGDSASSTELYAILSSLSGLPVHQGVAVTGSVNQKGMLQAIGGVNQKIDGFFDVCKAKGLTGRQGVIIPAANVKNLMLKKEVQEAAAAGRFHVYSAERVEEGIEILTGVPAGKPDRRGLYPPKTVYGLVQRKLKRYLQQSLQLKKGPADGADPAA